MLDLAQLATFVQEQFQTNQFLVGGIGTVAVGALGYLMRSVPQTIYLWFKRTTTSEFTINTRNKDFDQILRYLYRTRIKFFSRNYAVDQAEAKLVPGYGFNYGWYGGRPLVFRRYQLENKNRIEEEISITFFTRKLSIIEKFLKDSTSKEGTDVGIFVENDGWWRESIQRPARSLDTVFMNQKTKETIVNKIKWFVENEEWYVKRGIPYKLCIRLYGPPGTGKTSLILALASQFKRDIRYIKTLGKIDNLMNESNNDDFIVIEDIDTLSTLTRDEEDNDSPVAKMMSEMSGSVMHRLLNVLDGLQTPHGAVFIMTTNHPERFDPALTRVGRVDMDIEIGLLGSVEVVEMYKSFFGEDERMTLIEDIITAENQLNRPLSPVTGAVLQEIFCNNDARQSREKYISLSH